jgi:hypothetical protein
MLPKELQAVIAIAGRERADERRRAEDPLGRRRA